MRWALIEAIQRIPRDCVIGAVKDAIIARRGKQAKNIAKVAAARRLLTLIYYGMRDGRSAACPSPPISRPSPRPAGRHDHLPPAGGKARGRQTFCPAVTRRRGRLRD